MYCQIVYYLFNYQVHQLNRIGYWYWPISAMNNRLSEYRLKSLISATVVVTIPERLFLFEQPSSRLVL